MGLYGFDRAYSKQPGCQPMETAPAATEHKGGPSPTGQDPLKGFAGDPQQVSGSSEPGLEIHLS